MPTSDATLLARLLDTLAEISELEEVTFPRETTIEALLRQRCGFASDELMEVVRESNPGVSLLPSPVDRTLLLPACPHWEFSKSVRVLGGGVATGEALMLVHMGRAGAKTRRSVLALNQELRGSFKHLQANQLLHLPYVTRSFSVILRAGIDYQDAIRALGPFAPLMISAPQLDATVDLVRDVSVASSEMEQDCIPPDPSRWPFDRGLVLEILEDHLGRGYESDNGRITIVVADTGIDREDLAAFPVRDAAGERNERETNQRDDDDNGFTDDRFGANMFGAGGFPARDPAYDRGSHGTEVASLVLGGMQSDELTSRLRTVLRISIANVVKREKTAAAPTRWLINSQSVSDSLRYTEGIQARLLNWSIQSWQPMSDVATGLERYDTSLVVVAAGNDSTYVDESGSYPTAYVRDHRQSMITVAAHSPPPIADLTDFSNSGVETIDLAAPGCGIETLSVGGVRRRVLGTSFAAPLVTFTAALLMAEGMTEPEGIKRRILTTVELDPSLADYVSSGGRLDIPKAISIADDVVQKAPSSTDDGRMRSGRILDSAGGWPLCGRLIDSTDVLRIVPRYDPDSRTPTLVVTKKHLASSGADTGMHHEHCELPSFSIQFQERTKGSAEKLAVADLADIVPAIR